jgi:phospholipid/cholesterol/gamma-HCH transport system substrate-binding protein
MRKEVQFGIIAVITAVMVFVGLNYLGGSQYFGAPMVLYANYPKISGLFVGNQVFIKGVSVGKVADIRLNMDEGFEKGFIRVKMELNEKYPIPVNSRAILFNVDLLGAKGIEIRMPDETAASVSFLKSGGDINGSVDRGIMGEAEDLVFNEGAKILLELGKLTVQLNEIVQATQRVIGDEQYTGPLRATFQNVEATTANLALISLNADSISTSLTQTSRDASSVVANVKNNEDRINEILVNVQTTTDSLAAASSAIKKLMTDASSAVASVENIAVKLDTTTGTIGLLLNDRQLYDSLVSTTANLNVLLREAEENPQRFIDDIKLYLFDRRKKEE